jgi:WD40 repeat protein
MGEGPLGGAGEDPLDQFGGVLAAPPPHPVRRAVVGAGTAIVAIAAVIAAVIAVNHPATAARPVPSRHPAGLVALTDPGAGPSDDASGVIAFNRDGAMLATGGGNGQTFLWDVARSRLVATLAGPHAGVSALAFSPDGTMLAVGYASDVVLLWDPATGHTIRVLHDPEIFANAVVPGGGITTVAFNADGTTLAVGNSHGAIALWDVARWTVTAIMSVPADAQANAVAFSPDGTTLAAASQDGDTYLWGTTASRPPQILTDPDNGYNNTGPEAEAVGFNPAGTLLAVADDGTSYTYVWSLATARIVATLADSGKVPEPDSVAFSPSGTMVAVGDGIGAIYLFSTAGWSDGAILSGPDGAPVQGVAFSPDGRMLAAGDSYGTTYLWHVS